MPHRLFALWWQFSWGDWRRHPGRGLSALAAVALGVALAFAVHLIHASALQAFAQSLRAASGQADVVVEGRHGDLPDEAFALLARLEGVQSASAVLEVQVLALGPADAARDGQHRRVAVRLIGLDALLAPTMAPALIPHPAAKLRSSSGQSSALAGLLFAPDTVFLNAAAERALSGVVSSSEDAPTGAVSLQIGDRWRTLRVAGGVRAPGPPLAVMDIAAAQDLLGRTHRITRVDLRLHPDVEPQTWLAAQQQAAGWPAQTTARIGSLEEDRAAALSAAYRANLSALALVALFSGAFLVHAVVSQAFARRAAQFALLGVLGLSARGRGVLALSEALVLGALGSALGLTLGLLLARWALTNLGGDLGAGFFQGTGSSGLAQLQVSPWATLAFAALGLAAASAGGALAAWRAAHLSLAASLKGAGDVALPLTRPRVRQGAALGLLGSGLLLALLPAWNGVPYAAYASVGCLLLGVAMLLPDLVRGMDRIVRPTGRRHALLMLASARVARRPDAAIALVGGVFASMGLVVALTVMVTSFRASVSTWLDTVLPADLYVRAAPSATLGETAWLPEGLAEHARSLPQVRRVQALHTQMIALLPDQPRVALMARELTDPVRELPLVGALQGPPSGLRAATPVFVSEAVAARLNKAPGDVFPEFSDAFQAIASAESIASATFYIAGIYRDYARSQGSLVVDRSIHECLVGIRPNSDLAIWLQPGANAVAVQQALREPARAATTDTARDTLEIASSAEIRERSMKIFDRSFVITTWLQGVALGIGLFGIAAATSAQTFARRPEFGMLSHLGLSRSAINLLVALEGMVLTAVGAGAGLAAGLGVSAVLVHVVNPQSFLWTMDWHAPWGRLGQLWLLVTLCGAGAAWCSATLENRRGAVLAVREEG